MNCPVCDKSGLPDFTSNPTTCPQCNSDLSGFVVIEKGKLKFHQILNRQKWLLLLIVILFIISGIAFIKQPNIQKYTSEVQLKDSIITALNFELNQKETEIQQLKEPSKASNVIEFKYVVKKGDNLSKIAFLFFNDWEMYKTIQKENDLKPGDLIMPKDTLTIKIKSN
jgi:hypothetical protein